MAGVAAADWLLLLSWLLLLLLALALSPLSVAALTHSHTCVLTHRHYGEKLLRLLSSRMLGQEAGEDAVAATWNRVYEVRPPALQYPVLMALGGR